MLQNLNSAFDEVASVMRGFPNLPVQLVKQYKGLELRQEVRFVEVDEARAALETTYLDYCPILEGEIHLHSQVFPKPLAAQLSDFDYGNGLIFLSDFAYMDWKERQYDRVQPKDPTYIDVHCRRRDCRVFLEDISVQGVGLLLNKQQGNEIHAQPGYTVTLDIELAPNYRFTRLRGVLRYVRKLSGVLLKAGIQLYPNVKQGRSLEEYISHRREEILEEVNQTSLKQRAPRGVESLYF